MLMRDRSRESIGQEAHVMNITHGQPGTSLHRAQSSSWSVMEARLVAAKVEDLLTDAARRLERLVATEDLCPEVTDAVEEALRDARSGKDRVSSVRRQLLVDDPAGDAAALPADPPPNNVTSIDQLQSMG